MATFGQIAKGTRARKRVKLPLAGAHFNTETLDWDGDVVELDIRSLSPVERSEVLACARAFAVERGVENPTSEDPIYAQAVVLHTLVRACIDVESPADAPAPFFDGGFDQLHSTQMLSSDHIAYLYELQTAWEDEVSPRIRTLEDVGFMAAVIRTAQGDARFFLGSRPGIQWSFVRTLASLHASSRTDRSGSGSNAATSN